MRTNKLIEKVRLGLSLPKVENRFSNENLLDLANDELQSSILPWIFSLREDFLVSFIVESRTRTLKVLSYLVLPKVLSYLATLKKRRD